MSNISDIYGISLKGYRETSKTELRAIEHSYFILKDKDSDYAAIIKSLMNLKRSVHEVYMNADDDIFSDRKAF